MPCVPADVSSAGHEFSFRHGLHGFHRDFSFLLCFCHPVLEGSHIMLSHALREMSRQARHDRDTLSKSVTNPCNPCLKITRLYIIWYRQSCITIPPLRLQADDRIGYFTHYFVKTFPIFPNLRIIASQSAHYFRPNT